MGRYYMTPPSLLEVKMAHPLGGREVFAVDELSSLATAKVTLSSLYS